MTGALGLLGSSSMTLSVDRLGVMGLGRFGRLRRVVGPVMIYRAYGSRRMSGVTSAMVVCLSRCGNGWF